MVHPTRVKSTTQLLEKLIVPSSQTTDTQIVATPAFTDTKKIAFLDNCECSSITIKIGKY
jgi:hypothetical protein